MDNNYNYSQSYSQPTPPIPSTGGKQGFAIASLVCGIVSITLCCCIGSGIFQMIVAIAGLVLGIIAKKNGYDGQKLALAGIITSAIGIVVGIIMLIIGGALLATGGYEEYLDMLNSLM